MRPVVHAAMQSMAVQGEKEESRSDLEGENVSADKLDGPKFKFWVTDRHQQKLDYARATALLFTLNLVFGTEVRHASPVHTCVKPATHIVCSTCPRVAIPFVASWEGIAHAARVAAPTQSGIRAKQADDIYLWLAHMKRPAL